MVLGGVTLGIGMGVSMDDLKGDGMYPSLSRKFAG